MATSNNSIQTFTFAQNIAVRSLIIAGEPWFVAADVCKALDIGNVSQAMARLDGIDVKTVDFATLILNDGRENQQLSKFSPKSVNIVNESGLYDLILSSRKKSARSFRKWVTSEVLPAIRKTGTYTVPAAQAQTEAYTSKESIQHLAALTATATGQHVQAVHKAIRERFNVPNLDNAHGIPLDAIVAFLNAWAAQVASRAIPNPKRKSDYVELTIPAEDVIPDLLTDNDYYTAHIYTREAYSKGSPIDRLRKAVKSRKPIASCDLSGLLVEIDMLHSIAQQAIKHADRVSYKYSTFTRSPIEEVEYYKEKMIA